MLFVTYLCLYIGMYMVCLFVLHLSLYCLCSCVGVCLCASAHDTTWTPDVSGQFPQSPDIITCVLSACLKSSVSFSSDVHSPDNMYRHLFAIDDVAEAHATVRH